MRGLCIILFLASFFLLSGVSFAACTSPERGLGTLEYFTGTNEYKFCNGTDWISFSSASNLSACADTAQWEWDAAESAYKYCNGSVEKEPGCLWNSSGGGGGSGDGGPATCPNNDPDWSSSSSLTLNNPDPEIYGRFGNSVAISGNLAVVGAYWDDVGAVTETGVAYVFDTTDGSLITTLDNPDPADYDNFGESVSISGTTAVVGVYKDDVGAVTEAGAAYIFDTTDGSLIATLNASTPASGEYFGVSVAISGTKVVVGASRDGLGGTAYVFDATDGSLITTLNNPTPNSLDHFGHSVAISGNLAVVGAILDDSGGVTDSGTAYVFDVTDGSLIATLNNPAPTEYDRFGRGVAISGTIAVVGAKDDDPGGFTDSGTAYVFDATNGSLITTLNNPDPSVDDFFGESVAISGATAVVGVKNNHSDGFSFVGAVYVFDATDGSLIATLDDPNQGNWGYFGSSVAISGTTTVVGAYGYNPGGVNGAGTAYVFDPPCSLCQVDVTGGGLPESGPVLNNPDAQPGGDLFGIAVAIYGTTAVVGAHFDDPGGVVNAGTAYVLDTTDGSLIWTLNNPAPQSVDWFGARVAISGTTVVVGAHEDDPGGISGAGSAYVFDTTDGSLTATLNNPDPTIDDFFGYGVSVSGNTAVVSAPDDDPGGLSSAGTVYVFDATDGTLINTLNSPDPAPGDYFGNGVAISGTVAVVGVPGEDIGGVGNAGIAYVFDVTDGSLISTLNNPNPEFGDNFGYDVSVSGTTAIIGVPTKDSGGSPSAGMAYVFDITDGTLLATLNNPEPGTADRFGISVSVSGNTAVVGAYLDNPGGVSDAGTAYAFNAKTGALIGTLNNPDPTDSDRFGRSVSVSGTTAVVGAYNDDEGNTDNVGRAYTFKFGAYGDFSGTLTETAINSPGDQEVGDWFGRSVAASGNIGAFGTVNENTGGGPSNVDKGAVHVINLDTMTAIQQIDNPNPGSGDFFGESVGLSGNTLVVGDPSYSSDTGIAYIFDADTATLLFTLNNPSAATGDKFGHSVAVSGTVAVVGASYDNPGGVSNAGTAYVFDTTDGSLISTLSNPDPTNGDVFSHSVAVSGTVAVVGAIYDDPGGVSGAGTAYVFDTTDGSLITTLNNPDPTIDDYFGRSAAVSGTVAVVGAFRDDPSGVSGAGTAYVFDTTDGSLISTLNNPDPATDDFFGINVAVSGTVAVVGVHKDDPGGVSDAGTAYVFDTTDGSLSATLNNPNPNFADYFGYSVAINGSIIIVGAYRDESDGGTGTTDVGRAYMFSTSECLRQEKFIIGGGSGGGGSGACYDEGSCTKTGAIDVINGKFVVCNGSVWEVFAE